MSMMAHRNHQCEPHGPVMSPLKPIRIRHPSASPPSGASPWWGSTLPRTRSRNLKQVGIVQKASYRLHTTTQSQSGFYWQTIKFITLYFFRILQTDASKQAEKELWQHRQNQHKYNRRAGFGWSRKRYIDIAPLHKSYSTIKRNIILVYYPAIRVI